METSKSCKPFLVVSLFGRGGIGLVFAPSLVEVEIVGLLPLGEVELVLDLYPSL